MDGLEEMDEDLPGLDIEGIPGGGLGFGGEEGEGLKMTLTLTYTGYFWLVVDSVNSMLKKNITNQ
jgi:hypothetical protein